MPGYDVQVLDEGGKPVPAGHDGLDRDQAAAAARLPADAVAATTSASATAISPSIPATTRPADAGFIDEDGYVYVMGRTDDIINVAGHRLSTGGMEEVLAAHPASPNAP